MQLLAPFIGVLTCIFMLAILQLIFVALLPGIFLRCLPWHTLQRAGARWCVRVARAWVCMDGGVYRCLHRVPGPGYGQVQLRGLLDPQKSYLLISNHQSWADILILFDVFGGQVPFLRFFMKRDLLWVPIIGVACWAMDFPFMRRYSKEAIAKNSALAEEDLRTTRKACEIYRLDPVTVVNFPEGTRVSAAKRLARGSPFGHLLRPKAAGLSFTLSAMGEQFAGIIDVTLVYQDHGKNLLWSWLCGQQADVKVIVDVLTPPAELLAGDYAHDETFRNRFQDWLNGLWASKEERLNKAVESRRG